MSFSYNFGNVQSRWASLFFSETICSTKVPANPSNMLISDGGSEDDNTFGFLLLIPHSRRYLRQDIRVSKKMINALGPHPVSNIAFQLFCTLAKLSFQASFIILTISVLLISKGKPESFFYQNFPCFYQCHLKATI
jgi:hypothetical protein